MTKYVPLADSVFDQPDDHFLFESTYYCLLGLFGDQFPSAKTIEAREDVPDSAKAGWHLWLFAINVASGGIPDFLLNHCSSAEQMILTHRALKTVQADEMLVLLEAAFPFIKEIARKSGRSGAFPSQEWFEQFHVNPDFPELENISKPSWLLAEAKLSAVVAKYLRAHRSELQRKSH